MVDSEIFLSILRCVGQATPEGEYEHPYAEIVVDPDNKGQKTEPDQVAFTIDVLRGNVVFRFATQYREATEALDEPSFSVTVRNEAGEEIRTITEDFDLNIVRDRYYHFDTADGALFLTVPTNEFSDNSVKVLRFDMTARLERWEWTEDQTKGEQLETISETKSITVSVSVVDVQHVALSAVPINAQWNEPFHLVLSVENHSLSDVDFLLECVESSEYEGEERVDLRPLILKNTCGSDNCVLAQKTQQYTFSTYRKKDWKGWYRKEACWYSYDAARAKRQYRYTYKLKVTRTEEPDELGMLVELVVPVSFTVDQAKLDHLFNASDLMARSCGEVAIAVAAAAAAAYMAAVPWIAACFAAIAALALFAATYLVSQADEEVKAMEQGCPVSFDSKYRELSEPAEEVRMSARRLALPTELEDLLGLQKRIMVLKDTMRTTYQRYLSARAKRDLKAAGRQRTYAQTLFSRLATEVDTLNESLPRAARFATRKIASIDRSALEGALADLKRRGLTEEDRVVLREKGFSDTQVLTAAERLPTVTLDDLVGNVPSRLGHLKNQATSLQQDSLSLLSKIESLDSMSNEDVALELFLVGMIGPEDFSNWRRNREMAGNYLIAEMSEIPHRDKLQLAEEDVYTTRNLLRRCRDDREVGKLSAATRINRSDISRWLGLAELMQIRGIAEEDASLLQAAGIRDAASLKRAKPERLREKMKTLKLKGKMRVRVPSEKAISKWIGSAAEVSKQDSRRVSS